MLMRTRRGRPPTRSASAAGDLDRGTRQRPRGRPRPRRRPTSSTSRPCARRLPRARPWHAPSHSGATVQKQRQCSTRLKRPACSTPIENVVFNPDLVRMREMIEQGPSATDHRSRARGPLRAARGALLGCRRRPAAGRCSTWAHTARRRRATSSARTSREESSPGARRSATPQVPPARTTPSTDQVRRRPRRDTRCRRWSTKGGLEGRFEVYGDSGRLIEDTAVASLYGFLERPAGYLVEKADAETGLDLSRAGRGPRLRLRPGVRRFIAASAPARAAARHSSTATWSIEPRRLLSLDEERLLGTVESDERR